MKSGQIEDFDGQFESLGIPTIVEIIHFFAFLIMTIVITMLYPLKGDFITNCKKFSIYIAILRGEW